MLHVRLMIVFLLASVVAFAQSGLEFGTASIHLRNDVFDLATVAQLVGSPHADLIVRNDFDLVVLDGDLPESAPPVAYIPGGDYPSEVIVIDVDGDGDMDIVDSCPGVFVRVHSQAGGTFVTDTYFQPSTDLSGRLLFGDYDDDGLLDISTGRCILFRQPAGGYVIQSSTLVPPDATGVLLLAEDFDGDGDVDIDAIHRAVGQTSWTSQIFRRAANGSLEPRQPQVLVNDAESLVDVFAADFDADGKMDLLVSSINRTEHLLRIRRFEAPSASTLTTIQNLKVSLRSTDVPTQIGLRGFIVKDLDGDGDRDFVVLALENLSSSPFGIILEGATNGDLSFHAGFGLSLLPNVSPHFVDWNLDGTVEMVFHDPSSDTLRSIAAGSLDFVPQITPTTTLMAGPLLLNGQTYFIGTTVRAQTTWSASTPSGTRPLRGMFIHRQLSSIGSQGTFQLPFNVADAITLGNGNMGTAVYGGPAAGVTSVSAAGFTLFTLRFGGQVTVDGGTPQSIDACDLMSVGLRARVTDVSGQPIVGQKVVASTMPSDSVLWASQEFFTDSLGYATLTGTLQVSPPATFDVLVNAGGVGDATVTLTVTSGPPVFIQPVLGIGQVTNFGEPFPEPFVVRLVDGANQPIVGAPVQFTLTGSATATSPTSVLTDASGLAFITASATGSGAATISVVSGSNMCGSAPTATFSAFVRRLSSSLTTNSLVVVYRHEHAGVPLFFAVDAPQPPTVRSYGTLYTSVLSPGPAFGFLDGLGYFEPADPTVVTGTIGSWLRIFGVTPALAGITVVMQIYGLDMAYTFPLSIVVSNPVTVTF